MPENILFLTRVYGAGFGAPVCLLQFTRDGVPAPVDTTQKPVRVEFEDSELAASRIAIASIQPTGNKGEFSFDVDPKGAGGVVGKFVADRDLTGGEEDLAIPFAVMILEEEGATGASVSFGAGRPREAQPATE